MTNTTTSQEDMAFVRVRDAYDLSHLTNCRVVCVGAGGSIGFIEDLARTGVGQIVLIDPDVIELPNVARQMVYRRDLGRPKVAALADRLSDINPSASILAHANRLDDFCDSSMRSLLFDSHAGMTTPTLTLLCGLTDNFAAQARANRIALKFGLPCLCAQTYAEGRGGEITFTYPGVTPACHRCVLKRRYDYYTKNASHAVTSSGSPIFTTTAINALKGYVTLAILHHGTGHPRWGSMLSEIAERNLIQVRLDPHIASSLTISAFDRVFAGADQSRLFFGEPLWLPQAPEPSCPDCGGQGDLRDVIGAFRDTRSSSPAAPLSCKIAKAALARGDVR